MSIQPIFCKIVVKKKKKKCVHQYKNVLYKYI